ncbi:MAG: isochorismatase family protein [Alphaproteobacteria bacterium]
MPLTQIDDAAALVVIDLQKGIVALPTAEPVADVVAKSARLAQAFRARNLPVVLVNVTARAPGRTDMSFNFSPPPDWADLAPELGAEPSDYRVTKMNVGAFYGTALELILRRRGVTQIVLTGVATSMGVEATARSAYDHGYNVVLVADAMTDMRPDAHKHSIEITFPRLGEVTTTADVLAKLEAR